jgi:hypothetical protein
VFFYRLITVNSDNPDFTNQWEIRFLQTLVYNNQGILVILAQGVYNKGLSVREYDYAIVNSIDIVTNGNNVKGILVSRISYSVNGATRSYSELTKKQIVGGGRSYYILMEDIIGNLNKSPGTLQRQETGTVLYANVPVIEIIASGYLVDPKTPLRYSIQNAFDGDPATSYVENTEDDLIKIEFSGIYRYGYINKIALINGYAQNNRLYLQNNRIKTIKQIKNIENTILEANCLLYQFVDLSGKPQFVIVEDIYRGVGYNDTCIAELNVKTDFGWLFGGIDE